MIGNVSDNLSRGEQPLAVVVGDLEPELILHGHDNLEERKYNQFNELKHVAKSGKTKV